MPLPELAIVVTGRGRMFFYSRSMRVGVQVKSTYDTFLVMFTKQIENVCRSSTYGIPATP